MENKSLLETIKSKYIFEQIFGFIKDKNFKLKLFIHSKLFQKKLELEFSDYTNAYLSKFKIELKNYFISTFWGYEYFNKEMLKKKLEEDILNFKVNFDIFKKYILHIIEEKIENLKKKNNEKLKIESIDDSLNIDIFSPFFEILSNIDYFSEIFRVQISINLIEKYNLKEDYISVFNKMNKLNLKYPILFFSIKDADEINNLQELNIDFNKLKKLIIFPEKNLNDDLFKQDNKKVNNNFSYFFHTLFSLENLENNLIYLECHLDNYFNTIEEKLFEKLNDYKSLRYLKLNNFIFKDKFIFKLYNLKYLYLARCTNFFFDENNILNLEDLYLTEIEIKKLNKLVQFPKLKKLNIYENEKFIDIIDFTNLPKLKYLKANPSNFLNLGENELQELFLDSNEICSEEIEKRMFKKILSIKTLKKFEIRINKLNYENLLNIEGKNISVKGAYILLNNYKKDCNIDNLLKKFPNLNELIIALLYDKKSHIIKKDYPLTIYIDQDKNCKINEFSLLIFEMNNMKMICGPYENLIRASIQINFGLEKFKIYFPILNDKCEIIFKSLRYFYFCTNNIDYNTLNNIYNNIDKMPSLEYFYLEAFIKDIDEEFNKKFLGKLLGLELDYLGINFNKYRTFDYYTLDELKDMFPNIKSINIKKIEIKNIQSKNNYNIEDSVK